MNAVTPITVYKMPTEPFRRLLAENPRLGYKMFCNVLHLAHRLQQHMFILSAGTAAAKLGLFLQLLRLRQIASGAAAAEIYLPMSRVEIAGYLDLAPETVSRAITDLVDRGAITLRGPRHVRIANSRRFESAISEGIACPPPPALV